MFLPSKEYCDEVVENSSVFYRQECVVGGYDVVLYNYRLASHSDFVGHLAYEMRGLTFVKDGNKWNRFLGLHKFFNVGENYDTLFENLKDKKVVGVYEKLDGSMITFVRFPDGSVRAKTKMSFETSMAIAANNFYNTDDNIRNFVDYCFERDWFPIFEYIAPQNQIVVEYEQENLILIALRDRNGKYLNIHDMFLDVETSLSYARKNLAWWLEHAEIKEGEEGWVIHFEDCVVKVKTKWYKDRHHLFTDALGKENEIIRLILEEDIDDIIADAKPSGYKLEMIESVRSKLTKYLNDSVKELERRRETFTGDRKKFVIENKSYPLFSVLMSCIEREAEVFDLLVKFVLKKTYRLEQAKTFLKEI